MQRRKNEESKERMTNKIHFYIFKKSKKTRESAKTNFIVTINITINWTNFEKSDLDHYLVFIYLNHTFVKYNNTLCGSFKMSRFDSFLFE